MAAADWTDAAPTSPAAQEGGWTDAESVPPPADFGARLGKVWDKPTPGSIFDLAKKVYQAVTLPGEVYQGNIDPSSDEGIRRAFDAAMVLNPAPLGRASAPFGGVAAPRAPSVPAEAASAVEAAGRLGTQIPRYMTSDPQARLAEGVKTIPWAGQPVVKAAEELRSGLGRAAEDVAEQTTPFQAGAEAGEGLRQWISDKSKEPVSDAYTEVERLFDVPTARVDLTNAKETAIQIARERANANLPQSKVVDILDNAISQPSGMNYEGIKLLRSYLGERTPEELVAEGISPTEAKRLYGPLTEDLGNAVRAAGGEDAFAAWQTANNLAKETAAKRQQLGKIVGTRGDAPPELIFSRLMAMAGTKSSANISRLNLAREAMGPEAWQSFGASVISRMGRDPQGEFSPQRFKTAFSAMSPDARNAVFSPDQAKRLNDLFTVSALVDEKINRFANVSKTAHTRGAFDAIMGLVLHPFRAVRTFAGGRLIANALSRPAVVRAATDYARAQAAGNLWSAATKAAILQRVILEEFPGIRGI